MGAKQHQERRAALLSGFVNYLVRNGMGELSLRPAAAALGLTPRTLLYYFRSKEKLLAEAAAEIHARERARVAEEIQRRSGAGSISQVVCAVWRWYAAKHREPYLRFFMELHGLAIARPSQFKVLLDVAGGEGYTSLLEEGLRSWIRVLTREPF